MRLTLLLTPPGAPPGLLGPGAWRTVTEADLVLAADPAAVAALASGGVRASLVTDPSGLEDHRDADRVAWLVDETTAAATTAATTGPDLDVVAQAAYDVPGARVLGLVAVMDRLRRECPWDQERTSQSLARYLLEETYETLEAIDTGDVEHLREELGDLLLQVVFQARIAAESGSFDIDDVAGGITEKLVYRHPHVFAGLSVADADEVDRNWEVLKAAEKQRASLLDGIPATLPALAYADKVLGRLATAGRPAEPPAEPEAGGGLGDALLALVVRARADGLDAEQELREAVRRLLSR